jgi:anti-sigma B factor antagonist
MSDPSPTPFQLTTASIEGTVFVTATGELDIATAPRLQAVLAEASAQGGTLVLDMSGLAFIDSTGIRVLLLAWQESQRDGFNLRLTRGSDAVMRAFELVGLLDQLPFIGRPAP